MDVKDRTIYRSLLFAFHSSPPHRKKYAISLLWLELFTDQFTFEDSLPHHARARRCSSHESYHLTIPSLAEAAAAAG